MTEEHVEMLVGYPNDIAEGILLPRDEIHQKGILHNVVHVIVFGERDGVPVVWLQQRSNNKTLFPNMYDFTATGHLDPDEDLADTAVRKMKEETGISLEKDNLIYIGKDHQIIDPRPDGGVDNEMVYIFVYNIDGDPNFKISEEVQNFGSVSISELSKIILSGADHANMKSINGMSRNIYKDQICCKHVKEWTYFMKYFNRRKQ